MSDRLVAPVVPPLPAASRSRLTDTLGGAVGASPGPLPLADLPSVRGGARLSYAMAKVDSSGRVFDRSVVQALGWRPGDRLTITGYSGAVILHHDPRGVFALPLKPRIKIPAPLRARYGIRAGDRVLLAADAAHGVLVMHTLAALDVMIVQYHAGLLRGEADEPDAG